MTPRQELGCFLNARGHCWLEHDHLGNAAEAFAHACQLDPSNESSASCLIDALQRWKRALNPRHPPPTGLPPLTVIFPPPQFPNAPPEAEKELFHLRAREWLLDHAEYDARWWQPLRLNPSSKPAGLPAHIEYRYSVSPDDPPEVRFLDRPPQSPPARLVRRPLFSTSSHAF